MTIIHVNSIATVTRQYGFYFVKIGTVSLPYKDLTSAVEYAEMLEGLVK